MMILINKIEYERKELIGKGSFGKCYKIKNITTNEIFAVKIVSKKRLEMYEQYDEMDEEISIHKTLKHPNVVQFISSFRDIQNVYIVMELCEQHSMKELQKRRSLITDYECRFYLHQILEGVRYLHDNQIIHRDLKLGNLFLNDKLNVKIGDFGLATQIKYEGERKKTLCGTPNYTAPEIFTKEGYSYEVDIWSIGIVMFKLLVFHYPSDYLTIRSGEYDFSKFPSGATGDLMTKMLQLNPNERPTVHECLKHNFFMNFFIPKVLPISCLTCKPRFDQLEGAENKLQNMANDRRLFTEINNELEKCGHGSMFCAQEQQR